MTETENDSKKFKVTKKTKKYWTSEEDNKLLIILKELESELEHPNKIKWSDVAEYFTDKTARQCYSRYRHINPKLNKGYWTNEEDDKLKELINIHGKKWGKIATLLKTRSDKQTRHHYLNSLDSKNSKKQFSIEENNKLINLFNLYVPKWRIIAKEFNGRTADYLKCRHYNLNKQKIKALNNIADNYEFNADAKNATGFASDLSLKKTRTPSEDFLSRPISGLSTYNFNQVTLEDTCLQQNLHSEIFGQPYYNNFNVENNPSIIDIDKNYQRNGDLNIDLNSDFHFDNLINNVNILNIIHNIPNYVNSNVDSDKKSNFESNGKCNYYILYNNIISLL